MIEIFSAKEKNLSKAQFDKLFDIIRIAYAETEREMFGDNYMRIEPEELESFIELDQVLVAFKKEKVVGGVRHYQLENNRYSFGLLASDFSYAKQGIGQTLINSVEEIAKNDGNQFMRIEILRPKEIQLSAKKRIGDWYQRIGYEYQNTLTFESKVPEKKGLSIIPCVFDFYLKPLN